MYENNITKAKELPAYQVRKREDWSQVFRRDQGWTGSDNSYSIPLPSYEGEQQTLFTFGDSFIGSVDPISAKRSADSIMVNNALGIYRGDSPDPDRLRILFGAGRKGQQAWSLFVPPMPNDFESGAASEGMAAEAADLSVSETSEHITSPDDPNYYWLQDGIVEDNKLWIFAMRVAPAPEREEGFRFRIVGTDLLSMNISDDGTPDMASLDIVSFPHDSHEAGQAIYFGAAILDEDDSPWVYVYGLKQEGGAKLLLARYPKGSISDFSAWRFFDGETWSAEFRDAGVLVSEISSECSVSRLRFGRDQGRLALIYNRNGVEPYIEMRLADTPEGPFSEAEVIYQCPEVDDEKGIYTYNAKAHPELSEAGTLLISYNVNTRKDWWHMQDGGIYRTRWIELRADELYLHPLLQSGAVLQRERELKLEGGGLPGETVELRLDHDTYYGEIDARGRFQIFLPPHPAGGPHILTFTSTDQNIRLEGIYFGDVFLAGGQSNMQLSFAESSFANEDSALFGDLMIRSCLVPQRETLPKDAAPGSWTTGPWQVLEGEALRQFSAVAAYTALRLRELNPSVPIGIVGAYMGATSASCWTAAETLAAHPEFSVYEQDFKARIAPWRDRTVFDQALSDFQTRSEAWQRKAADYRLDHPDAIESDLDSVLGPAPWPPPENENSFMRPSGLYETMLKPLAGSSFKAAIFYQGESDVAYNHLYKALFTAMHGDWQRLFGDLPIVQVQLPSYAADLAADDDGAWGKLREAQRQASLASTDVYHIAALDEGQLSDLHPRQKRMLGLRLAAILDGIDKKSVSSLVPAAALDAYFEQVEVVDGGLSIIVSTHKGMNLIYDPGRIGDERDRLLVKDSGFDLRLANSQVIPLGLDRVIVQSGPVLGQTQIMIRLDQEQMHHLSRPEAREIKLSYGARNQSVASFLTRPADSFGEDRRLNCSFAELRGTLEAFITEIS